MKEINIINKINNIINKKVLLIFIIFLYLQPVIDVITGISLNYFNSSFTLGFIIKAIFLLFMSYYLFFIKKKNKKYIVLLLLYSILFIITNIIIKDTNKLFEIKQLIRCLYLPISILFIHELFKDNKIDMKHLCYILIIYVSLIFIPNIFNIGFKSYEHSKVGSIGLFYSANAVGSILSFLLPITIYMFISKKMYKSLLFFILIYCYTIFKIGTKMPIICLFIIGLYFIILLMIKLRKESKKGLLGLIFFIILLVVLSIIIIPKTAFYKNLLIHLDFLGIESINQLFTLKNIDHFIFSSRLSFFIDTFNIFINSSILSKLFGIGYYFNNLLIKTCEMDILVIFIHQGIIGFILIMYYYLKDILMIFKNYFKSFKINFKNIEISSLFISVFVSIICAMLSGHVLDTPSVIIFVTLIINILKNRIKE